MQTFLVRLIKENTIKDLKNGIQGRYQAKNILIRCKNESEVRFAVSKFQEANNYKDFKIQGVQDWDVLRQVQVMQNIQYLFDKYTPKHQYYDKG